MHEIIMWQEAENLAKADLKRMFPEKNFRKVKNFKVGETKKEFDLVSDDGEIVVQVKLSSRKKDGTRRDTQLKRAGYDLLLLEKVSAKRKFFYLSNDDTKVIIYAGNSTQLD